MQCPVPADITNDSFADFWAAQEHEHADTLINKKLRVHYNIASPEELPALLAAASAAAAAAGVATGTGVGVASSAPLHHHHHHHDDSGAAGAVNTGSVATGVPSSVAATPALGVAATPMIPQSPYPNQAPISQQPAHDQHPHVATSELAQGAAPADRALHSEVPSATAASKIPGAPSTAPVSSPDGFSHLAENPSTPSHISAADHAAASVENRSKAVADEIEREKAAVFGTTKPLAKSTTATAARGPTTTSSTTTSAIPSNGPSSSSSSSSTYGTQPLQRKIIDGNTDIPLHQVIIMVIVSFLIGWFFF